LKRGVMDAVGSRTGFGSDITSRRRDMSLRRSTPARERVIRGVTPPPRSRRRIRGGMGARRCRRWTLRYRALRSAAAVGRTPSPGSLTPR